MTAPTLTPLAPQEAIAFFEPKGLRAGYAWQDVWHEEHAASFTVAKMMQTDLLATVQQSLADALKSGQTYEDWAKSITPTLQDAGWWGRSVMTDPLTGQDKAVQLGSPRRLRIIYDTNMRMSRAVGHWDRIQERKKERPYLRYVAVMDAQTRPDHARWHGIIRRVDDEFWKTHYPPCGWRCRCTVIQLSAADLERRGWKVTDDDALKAAGYGQTFQYVNPRTGEVIDVPAGIDPGFGYNVGIAGREAAALRAATPRINAAPPEIARPAAQAMLDSPAFERFLAGQPAADDDHQTAWPFPAPQRLVDALQATTGIVQLSADTMAKQRGETKRSRGHTELTVDEYRLIPDILETGKDRLSKSNALVRGVVKSFGSRYYLVVVKVTKERRGMFISSFRRMTAEEYALTAEVGISAADVIGMW